MTARHKDSHRWIVFVIICLAYFFVYFHRVSTSVIVTDLLESFRTNAAALGFMSSMYFYLYAVEQPVVGYLTDRLGPRRVIGLWSAVAAAGCMLFGAAPSIGWASAGRALIGIGVGGVYVPALKALSQWFDDKAFTGLLGVLMSVGNLGAVIATTPLAWAAVAWGWRSSFFWIGGLTFGLAVLTLLAMRDAPDPVAKASTGQANTTAADQKARSVRSDAVLVLSSKSFWIMGLLFFGVYGTFLTLQGLWATPFLMSALSIDRMFASQLNMLIPIGAIVGAPLFGWLSVRSRFGKHRLLPVILLIDIAAWVGLIGYRGVLGVWGLAAIQMVMGLTAGGFITVLWGIVRETTPYEILGLTFGMLNPTPFIGVAFFQVITGAILDKAGKADGLYAMEGFTRAFGVCLAANVICLGLCFCLMGAAKKR